MRKYRMVVVIFWILFDWLWWLLSWGISWIWIWIGESFNQEMVIIWIQNIVRTFMVNIIWFRNIFMPIIHDCCIIVMEVWLLHLIHLNVSSVYCIFLILKWYEWRLLVIACWICSWVLFRGWVFIVSIHCYHFCCKLSWRILLLLWLRFLFYVLWDGRALLWINGCETF